MANKVNKHLGIYYFEPSRVIDGDTLVGTQYLTSKMAIADVHVRLLGVYAPELRDKGGVEARAYLNEVLGYTALGNQFDPVWLFSYGDKKDSFGRTLGILYQYLPEHDLMGTVDNFLEGRENLNELLVFKYSHKGINPNVRLLSVCDMEERFNFNSQVNQEYYAL